MALNVTTRLPMPVSAVRSSVVVAAASESVLLHISLHWLIPVPPVIWSATWPRLTLSAKLPDVAGYVFLRLRLHVIWPLIELDMGGPYGLGTRGSGPVRTGGPVQWARVIGGRLRGGRGDGRRRAEDPG